MKIYLGLEPKPNFWHRVFSSLISHWLNTHRLNIESGSIVVKLFYYFHSWKNLKSSEKISQTSWIIHWQNIKTFQSSLEKVFWNFLKRWNGETSSMFIEFLLSNSLLYLTDFFFLWNSIVLFNVFFNCGVDTLIWLVVWFMLHLRYKIR